MEILVLPFLSIFHSFNPHNEGIDFRPDVCRCQILTSKVDPRTVRVNIFITIKSCSEAALRYRSTTILKLWYMMAM